MYMYGVLYSVHTCMLIDLVFCSFYSFFILSGSGAGPGAGAGTRVWGGGGAGRRGSGEGGG